MKSPAADLIVFQCSSMNDLRFYDFRGACGPGAQHFEHERCIMSHQTIGVVFVFRRTSFDHEQTQHLT